VRRRQRGTEILELNVLGKVEVLSSSEHLEWRLFFASAQMRARAFDPRLDEGAELLSKLEKFSRFGGCGNFYPGVVDHVPLASASIEEQHQSVGLFPKGGAGAFKAQSMMARNSGYTIARAGCCHPRHLQDCVICGCESAIL
jgi:hypothetical protein